MEEFDRAGGDELIFTLGPRQVHTLAETLPQAAREYSLRLQFTDFLLALVMGGRHLTSELLARLLQSLANAAGSGAAAGRAWREFARPYSTASVELLADLNEGTEPELLERCAAVERLAQLHFPHNEAYLGLILAIEVLLFSRHASAAESRRALNDYICPVRAQSLLSASAVSEPAAGVAGFPGRRSSMRRSAFSPGPSAATGPVPGAGAVAGAGRQGVWWRASIMSAMTSRRRSRS